MLSPYLRATQELPFVLGLVCLGPRGARSSSAYTGLCCGPRRGGASAVRGRSMNVVLGCLWVIFFIQLWCLCGQSIMRVILVVLIDVLQSCSRSFYYFFITYFVSLRIVAQFVPRFWAMRYQGTNFYIRAWGTYIQTFHSPKFTSHYFVMHCGIRKWV